MMDGFQKAQNTALRLLKFRYRSEKEMRDHLLRKDISPEVVDRTVAWLYDQRLLDDELFTEEWIRSRRAGGYGAFRVARELRLKGIAKETIDRHLEREYGLDDRIKVIRELIERRMRLLRNEPPLKRKRKIYSYLLVRGFSYDEIDRALEGGDL